MGKLKDMFATQIREYSNYEKKLRWEQTKPSFINLKTDIKKVNELGIKEFDLVVTNVLNITDKRRIITKVENFDENGLITKIFCPTCGNVLILNRHWNAFICENGHKKEIYEIKDMECKRPKQIMQLIEEDW